MKLSKSVPFVDPEGTLNRLNEIFPVFLFSGKPEKIVCTQNLVKKVLDMLKEGRLQKQFQKHVDLIGYPEKNMVIYAGNYVVYAKCKEQRLRGAVFFGNEKLFLFMNSKGNVLVDMNWSVWNETEAVEHATGLSWLVQFLLFVELETIFLKSKGKYKPRKYQPIKNDLQESIVVADAGWNTETISGPFMVSGHYRLQPFGEGLKKLKVVWIDPYKKKGYNRKSGKERSNF